MRIKADWDSYLHKIRTHEFEAVFSGCPERLFASVLELGAGDGFVSTLLAEYSGDLISTDYNEQRLTRQGFGNVTYRTCDAEEVAEHFAEQSFDLVFSSNLLEHLAACDRAMSGIHRVLKDDGITIHFLPNRNWKLITVLLHIPNKVAKFVDRILSGRIFKTAKVHKRPRKRYSRNNPKLERRRRFFLAKLLLPRIHGVSGNTISEFIAFGKNRRIRQFERHGFEILDVRNLGFNSGYGFGCDGLRKLMEKVGIHTSYAYIARKAGTQTGYDKYFQQSGESRIMP